MSRHKNAFSRNWWFLPDEIREKHRSHRKHRGKHNGAWGAGFVMALSARWQEPEWSYRALTAEYSPNPIPPGLVRFVRVEHDIQVANIIGQNGVGPRLNGKPPVNYQALLDGLLKVESVAAHKGASVHMPRIGCGLAGGQWEFVRQLVGVGLCAFDIPVFVYDPAKVGIQAKAA